MGTIFKNVLLEDDTGGGCAALTDIFGMGNPSPTAFSYFSIVGEAFRLPLFDYIIVPSTDERAAMTDIS